MVVVTGEPRSGTSLMMRIIDSLGLEITGDKHAGQNRPNRSEKRKERAEYLNPEGFWEVPGIVSSGIRTEDQAKKYEDKVIKIVTHGLSHTVKPAIDKIKKIIFCLRDPREIAYSQKKLVSGVEVAGKNKEDWEFSPENMQVDLGGYIMSVGGYIIKSVKTDLWDKTLVVNYEDTINEPEVQIKRISNFLGVPYNPESKNLIRKELYRSVKVPEVNSLTDNIYNAIKTKNFSNVLEPIKKYIDQKRIESVRWLDDIEYKTWTIAGWSLHKSLATNNNNVRDNLVRSANIRSIPTECNYYDPTGEEYTVERVEQLGPLTRTKIKCSDKKEEVTREQCFNCWQQILIGRRNPSVA
jgi:hypothetical protein